MSSVAWRRPLIFVADDSRMIHELVSVVLEGEGFDVVAFDNGADLLIAALRNPPDAIVLDIEMPVMDGLETLHRIVGAPTLASLPIMMLTGNSQAENVQQALSAGAQDFIVKPFDTDLLGRRVRRLLEQPRHGPAAEVPRAKVTATESPELARIRLAPVILVVGD